MTDAIWQIERERRKRGLSSSKLVGLAGVNPMHYSQLVARKAEPRKNTISRLKLALAHYDQGAKTLPELLIFRLCLLLVCQSEDVSPADVLSQDPQRKANADPQWKRAADIRRRAIYLAHSFCLVSQVRLATIVGLTPAAISQAVKSAETSEDLEDDPLIELIETVLGGL